MQIHENKVSALQEELKSIEEKKTKTEDALVSVNDFVDSRDKKAYTAKLKEISREKARLKFSKSEGEIKKNETDQVAMEDRLTLW